MKLVVDTNVIISGALWEGPSAKLLAAILTGQAQMFISDALLREIQEVLRRPRFAERLTGCGETPETIVTGLRAACFETTTSAITAPKELRDADVDVLACAVAAGADAIVSGDQDLLVLGSYEGIAIITAREPLRRLGVDVQ